MCNKNELNGRLQKSMKMTVRKIAEAAGVSPAAVSLVLNDKPGVRPELRTQITDLLLQNGYSIRKRKRLLKSVFSISTTGILPGLLICAMNSAHA